MPIDEYLHDMTRRMEIYPRGVRVYVNRRACRYEEDTLDVYKITVPRRAYHHRTQANGDARKRIDNVLRRSLHAVKSEQ